MFDIQENLKNLPDTPGVYMHKDALGNIIYVGKAISLRNRVRQYFQSSRNMEPRIRSMVSQIAEFEYITAASETEALILECNLIKKHRPKYNILLRDDKTYPYIKITNEPYPRVVKTRIVKKDGGRYYGPYSDVGAVNDIVDLLNSTYGLKRCNAVAFPKGFKPCLNYHINQCRGICTGCVQEDEYMAAIGEVREFMSGRSKAIITKLRTKMMKASEDLKFEEAAVYRDHIESAKALSATQRVVLHHDTDMDIVLPARGAETTNVAVFFVRESKLVGRETHEMDNSHSADRAELISAFINQYYGEMPNIPREILVKDMPEDREALQVMLSDNAGHNVTLIKPQKGEKRALVDLASRDVLEMVKTIDKRAANARERKETLGSQIFEVLSEMGAVSGDYDGRQFRAEAYDISNTNGVDTVGAMVVYEGLRPDKSSYRKFKIRTVKGQDDYASMTEVLSRRFRRVFEGDEGFSLLPDIIFMDGGKGHVSTALAVVDETGFDIPVVGMVKDDKHRTRALIYRYAEDEYREIPLKGKGLLFKYIGTMQEEVHRFAIEYHRKVRGKRALVSVLDEIEGIGSVRRQELLKKFGSVENIGKASVEELAGTESMNMKAAQKVWDYFHEGSTAEKTESPYAGLKG
ncbi:MAG: excinuclease ABC subunit UvrC [Firmicutes bacterium]|nr:excinuclease ABC subunit UvrC [Bacillota bacterium]